MKKILLLGFAALSLTGCATLGPKAAKDSHQPYNEAIIASWNEQMLLNIVRLHYRDNPYFLQVNNVTSSFNIKAGFETDNQYLLDTVGNLIGFNPTAMYEENPTISYVPVQGEKFTKQMMSPIAPETILVLSKFGWGIDRVFDLCVESVNDIENAVGASGPTPALAPEYRKFDSMSKILRSLQDANLMHIGTDPESGKVAMLIKRNAAYEREIKDLYELLGVASFEPMLKLSTNMLETDTDMLRVQPRSLMGVMFYLSQSVQAPAEHVAQGLVTCTKTKEGKSFNWNRVSGKEMIIRSKSSKPKSSLRVKHRGYWFYIDEADLHSKSTFMLLSKLFNLQAGNAQAKGPVLTIPVSA